MFDHLSRRFTPRLETLDGRVLPGGLTGGVFGDSHVAAASQLVRPLHIGEEIPQVPAGSHDVWGGDYAPQDGHVNSFGGHATGSDF